MVDKSHVDKELARRMCAATQYKNTPDVGDLWYFLAALAEKLVIALAIR
jgi:hypothetical protein